MGFKNGVSSGVTKISHVFAWAGGLLVLLSAVLVTLDVMIRNFFRLTILESFELTGYAFGASVTLGFAYALIAKSHIRIEVVYVLFRRPIRIALDVVAIVFLALAAIVLAWYASQAVLYSYANSAHSTTTLAVPLVVPQGVWLVGIVWFALVAVWLAINSVLNLLEGRPELVDQEIGVLALQEEITLSSRGADLPPIDIR